MEDEKQKNQNLINDPALKRLRTYEEDVKDAIKNEDISTTKIVLAEQAKKERESFGSAGSNTSAAERNTPNQPNKNFLVILVSILLIGAGSVLVYFNYESLKSFLSTTSRPENRHTSNVATSDKKITIDSIGKTKGEIIREIQEIISKRTSAEKGNIVEINITKDVSRDTDRGLVTEKEPISAVDFFSLIDSRAPEVLTRSFQDTVLIGLHLQEKFEPFIILKSEDVAQTYSGMLGWENFMVGDMTKIFFENLAPREIITSNDNASEDPDDDSLTIFAAMGFSDRVIANKDARVITNNDGQILFFYSIVDNENVIMTSNRDTFILLLDRINQVNLIR